MYSEQWNLRARENEVDRNGPVVLQLRRRYGEDDTNNGSNKTGRESTIGDR